MPARAVRELRVRPEGGGWRLELGGWSAPCAVGRGGPVAHKREGDGGTPIGRFRLRGLYFRPDRGFVPRCGLPLWPLRPNDGWSDAPLDAAYNRAVMLPRGHSAERLWRGDRLYDLIVPLGYNDRASRPGAGSAIFLHEARPGLTATEGCVTLRRPDLLALLPRLDADCWLRINPIR